MENKRTKGLILEASVIAVFVVTITLFSLDLSHWRELSVVGILSTLIQFETIASLGLLILALMIFLRLRYKVLWMIILIALAVAGFGVDLPERFVLHPEKISLVRVFLTFIVILTFWLLETLERKYVGGESYDASPLESDLADDEIIMLNLVSNEETTRSLDITSIENTESELVRRN